MSTLPSSRPLNHLPLLGFAAQAREHFHADWECREALLKRREMLERQDGRRHENGDLPTVIDGAECGSQCDLRLAESDVADNQSIHRLRRLEVFLDRRDRGRLVGGLRVREGRRQLVVPQRIWAVGRGPGRLTRGVELDQLEGHFADCSPHPPPRLLPLSGAEASQGRVDASA